MTVKFSRPSVFHKLSQIPNLDNNQQLKESVLPSSFHLNASNLWLYQTLLILLLWYYFGSRRPLGLVLVWNKYFVLFRFDPRIKFTLCWDVASTEMMVLFFSLHVKSFITQKFLIVFPIFGRKKESQSRIVALVASWLVKIFYFELKENLFTYLTLISKCCFCFYSLLLM